MLEFCEILTRIFRDSKTKRFFIRRSNAVSTDDVIKHKLDVVGHRPNSLFQLTV